MIRLFKKKACDQVIDVNGQKFSRISHEDALLILKTALLNYRASSVPIKIAVRYLGKLPVLKPLTEKIDTHVRLDDAKLDRLQSAQRSFSSLKCNVKLLKHYLAEYLNNKINVQYFLYLLVNFAKLSKKVINLQLKIFTIFSHRKQFIF